MSLSDTIKASYIHQLSIYGFDFYNKTKEQTYKALFTSSSFTSGFTLSEQDIDDQIQGVTLIENLPSTGDVIIIGENAYRVNQLEKRVLSPIGRFYAELMPRYE